MEEAKEEAEIAKGREKNVARMNAFLPSSDGTHRNGDRALKGRPLADLFPDATVMFADIAGFTAWSSTREPTHVFMLLESLYSSFDSESAPWDASCVIHNVTTDIFLCFCNVGLAKRRKVFKVEVRLLMFYFDVPKYCSFAILMSFYYSLKDDR